jgi:threonyl-tRNA synthetase
MIKVLNFGSINLNEIVVKKPQGIDICKSFNIDVSTVGCIFINGEKKDIRSVVKDDDVCQIIFLHDIMSQEVLNHSKGHLFAQSLKELFPLCQLGIGPATENSFFYDIKNIKNFSQEDIENVIKKMKENIFKKQDISLEFVTKEEAIEIFTNLNEKLKVDIINSLNDNERISLYRQGNFVDLCKGPHILNTGMIDCDSFSLENISEVQWKDSYIMQRIKFDSLYSKKHLEEFLVNKKEMEEYNHLNLGKKMKLFFFNKYSPGSVFWLPNGMKLRLKIIEYIRNKLVEYDYLEVRTPVLYRTAMWETSGHLEKYQENIFFTHTFRNLKKIHANKTAEEVIGCHTIYNDSIKLDINDMIHNESSDKTLFFLEKDDRSSAMKPMSCPAHLQIFQQMNLSYKDLPKRLSEFGHVHRNEPKGAMQGLTRIIEFTQDDAHILIRNKGDDIKEEFKKLFKLLKEIYEDFGFDKYEISFSDKPEHYIGNIESWDIAESAMKKTLIELNIPYIVNKGDGAFYGPKFDIFLRDNNNRKHQCCTIQLDFFLPEKFKITIINEEGEKEKPVLIHRAILGSIERFLGILLESYRGILPLWIAPIQIALIQINNKVNEYGEKIGKLLQINNIDYKTFTDDTLNHSIQCAIENERIPVIVIYGKKESDSLMVSVRVGNKKFNCSLDDFIKKTLSMIQNKHTTSPEY